MAAAAVISISTKLAEPKHFAGKGQEAHLWLSALERYYIVVGIEFVMTGNVAR